MTGMGTMISVNAQVSVKLYWTVFMGRTENKPPCMVVVDHRRSATPDCFQHE